MKPERHGADVADRDAPREQLPPAHPGRSAGARAVVDGDDRGGDKRVQRVERVPSRPDRPHRNFAKCLANVK